MQSAQIRMAKHAGSWYQRQKDALNKQLDKYLAQVQCTIKKFSKIKAVIGPHAGYAYSGPTAAWAYKYLQNQENQGNFKLSKIFLLGPSHKKYIQGCSISGVSELQTPLGNLKVDTEQIKVLESKGKFSKLTKKQQENQHSLQMHMPYIYKVFKDQPKVIPIIVGQNDMKMAEEYGKLLAPYFDRDDTIFIISSDFCHWGPHFDYQPCKEGAEPWKFIQQLDRQGMKLIQQNNINEFDKYIDKTGNTICGEQPIRILMNIIKHSKTGAKTEFVRYAQSEKAKSFEDSSVSYASSITFVGE